MIYLFTFFFSSRRRHTRWPRDWSSDVCSSDLRGGLLFTAFVFCNPIGKCAHFYIRLPAEFFPGYSALLPLFNQGKHSLSFCHRLFFCKLRCNQTPEKMYLVGRIQINGYFVSMHGFNCGQKIHITQTAVADLSDAAIDARELFG